jgi:hypothetical protein
MDPTPSSVIVNPEPSPEIAVDMSTPFAGGSAPLRANCEQNRTLATDTTTMSSRCNRVEGPRITLRTAPTIGLPKPETLHRLAADGEVVRATTSGYVQFIGYPKLPRALAEHAERWRPWRSYAAQYLWATLDQPAHRRLRAAPSDDLRVRQHDRPPEH